MSPQIVDQPQINWEMMRHWQIWDPMPEWWRLDEDKLAKVVRVQFDHKIRLMEQELEQMRVIREIVVG